MEKMHECSVSTQSLRITFSNVNVSLLQSSKVPFPVGSPGISMEIVHDLSSNLNSPHCLYKLPQIKKKLSDKKKHFYTIQLYNFLREKKTRTQCACGE